MYIACFDAILCNWFRNNYSPQRAPNPPDFAQPGLSGSKGQSSPAKDCKIWVCLFLSVWSLPRCEGANLGVFHLCHFDLPSGAPGLHALLNYFGINFVLITLTLTPLIVLGVNFKSVIGALWDCTCTLEITLTLLNCFQINFQKNITLTLTLLLVFELQM